MTLDRTPRVWGKALPAVVWALFVMLLLLGIFRRELPESLRGVWIGLMAGTSLTGAILNAIRTRFAAGSDRFPLALFSVFFLILAAMYIQPQRVASDGVFYFAPLHSVIVDWDLDFENEYRVLGVPEGYFQRTETGRLPNHHSIGPAIVWTPLYLVVHGLALLGLLRPTGFGYPYFTAVATATAIGGFLGILWLYRLARELFETHIAFAATLLLWLGSFLVWYMVFEPSMSHALAMASVSGLLLLCQRGPEDKRDFLFLGIAAGFVVLIRWQNVLFLPVGLALAWKKTSRRPRWTYLALAGATAGLVFLPQMVFWKLIYGNYLLVPQGSSYMQWGSPELEAVLFSSRHGLLSWSPLLWIGGVGFIGVVRRFPILGWSLLGAFLASWYVNGSVHDWWAGASFGARRFDGSLPAFGLGLAAALASALPWIRRHALAASGIVLAPFVIWNFLLMGLYFGGGVPYDGPVSFRQAAVDGLEMIYRMTGYPFSFPGALAERFRSGAPPPVYDLAGARYFSGNVDIRMGDTDALYLGRGWSLPRRGAGETYREGASTGAFVYVALREPAEYRMTVDGRSRDTVEVSVNGRQVGRVDLSHSESAAIEISPERIINGVNAIRFSCAPTADYSIRRIRLTRPANH